MKLPTATIIETLKSEYHASDPLCAKSCVYVSCLSLTDGLPRFRAEATATSELSSITTV